MTARLPSTSAAVIDSEMLRRLAIVTILLSLPARAGGQPQQPASADPGPLAKGWAALAAGDLRAAAAAAGQSLAADPLNVAAAALTVEVEILRSGGAGGLAAYERWLGARTLEDGYLLRRIARAVLWDVVRQSPAARVEALKALADDGDAAAAAELSKAAEAGSLPELLALSSGGNERVVASLVERVQAMPAGKVRLINALGESGSPRAVPVLERLLKDPQDDHRAAAAEALGRIGATPAEQLKPLLNDPNFTVRLKAAGALYRLGDAAALPMLQQMASSEHAGVRLAAAEGMSIQPDAAWLSIVRELCGDADPAVRLQAARLIAPHDGETARKTLEALSTDSNAAVRDEAERLAVGDVLTDLGRLRQLLRAGSAAGRVAAAGRLLELSR